MVFLWTLNVPPRLSDELLRPLLSLLDQEGKSRSGRITVEGRRFQYLLSHALLLVQLSKVIGIPPGKIPLVTKAGERPWLRLENPRRFVSLSHCEDLVACAFAPVPVGIDVEKTVRDLAEEKVVERFFTEGEKRTYRGLPDVEKGLWFKKVWTLKEALYKAADLKMSDILSKVTFKIKPSGEVESFSNDWSFRTIQPTPNHLLALAVKGRGRDLCCEPITLDDLIKYIK